MTEIGKVTNSTPGNIKILLTGVDTFERNKASLRVSRYLVIADGNETKILASIQNISAIQDEKADTINYTATVAPIGSYVDDEDGINFRQGGVNLPSPTEPVYLPDDDLINRVFSCNENFSFEVGKLGNNNNIRYYVDGNKFFGKHIAVVGSTGSGKSCAVANILQKAMHINNGENSTKGSKKNSHIIIFDIHSEYRSAFSLPEEQDFTMNVLDVEKLCLPYWLMNSQELEALFIESNEMNSHNQISQFKKAVILSKEKHNPSMQNINYDTPVYFDIKDVYRYIKNKNSEVINKNDSQPHRPKLADGAILDNADNRYLEEVFVFATTSTAKDTKASNGPYAGDFERFLTRLETKLADKRLKFITDPKKDDDTSYKTEDFDFILMQFLGYIDKSNVTVIDLSAIPFEVLSIVVSLLSRVIFDFAFHYSKIMHEQNTVNDIPFMLVCEEAHNYIPKSGGAEYNASRQSIERIAKEGRKYGLNLMVVSQRPSEVSETIFSQCNNFIVLKLTNVNDQSCIKNLLPDNNSSLVDVLPTLAAGECLMVGDSVPLPAIVKMEMPNPIPSSSNVNVYDEWNKGWIDVVFANIIKRWRKE